MTSTSRKPTARGVATTVQAQRDISRNSPAMYRNIAKKGKLSYIARVTLKRIAKVTLQLV